MKDCRARGERGGARPLVWTRSRRPRRWRRGIEVKEEFGSALGEEAGQAKQNVTFFCLCPPLFLVGGGRGRRKGSHH